MTSILDQPVRVDRDGERLYFYAPGEVCVDICSGTPEDRKRVMALLEHVQEAFRVLSEMHEDYDGEPWAEAVEKVLQDAGVIR